MGDPAKHRAIISQMIRGEDAIAPFITNIDCKNYTDFERYLAGQVRQAMELRISLDREGDEDGLLDWAMAKAAAFHEALLTFRLVTALQAAKEPSHD